MTTIVKRLPLGRMLTVTELDANANNLNSSKLEISGGTLTGNPVLPDQNIDIIASSYPTVKPSLNLDFTKGTLDPRITFTRSSVGTYYDGKTTAKAEENLLTYSNNFTNIVWNLIGNTGITAVDNNAISPDGTTTATTLTCIAGTTITHAFSQNSILTSGVIYMASCYFKAGTYNYIAIGNNNGLTSICVNLSTGAIITGSGTVTSVGGGWYRINTLFSAAGARGIFFGITDNTGNAAFTTTGTETIYIWGAQLEQRSSVTAYTPTTNVPITNYIPVLKTAPANVPRFNYDPITGKSLGLLIEEARTNLITNSSELSSWNQGGLSVLTSNTIIAPDGTLSGDKLYTYTTNRFIGIPVIAGQIYAFSIYAKKDNSSSFGLELGSPAGGQIAFNFDTLAVGSNSNWFSNMTYTAVGNGWYRVSVLITATATGSPSLAVYGGANYGVAGSTFFWGAQLEYVSTLAVRTANTVTGSTNTSIILDAGASSTANVYAGNKLVIGTESQLIATYDAPTKTANVVSAFSFVPTSANVYTIIPAAMTPVGVATSYIPTTSGTVTRTLDVMSMTGTNFSSWYNHSELSIYCESTPGANTYSTFNFYFWNNAGTGQPTYLVSMNTTSTMRFQTGGSTTININAGSLLYGATNKFSFTTKPGVGSNILTLNGTVIGSVTSASWNNVPDSIWFTAGSSAGTLNGHFKKFVFYPKSLTSTELAALTS